MRQVVGHRHPLAVAGHRRVARVDAGAHLGDDFQVPHVELGDPAVARGEEDVAAVRREFRPAVQGEARLEAVDRLQLVAVEDGDMVIAGLDHHEQVQRIGLELRLVGQAAGREIDDARGGDLGLAPHRHRLDRRVGILDQRLDFVGIQLSPKPSICVAGRPSRMTFSASGLRRRARFSGISAGPMPPSRSGPWQAAQCCW